ncbi:Hypothetical protein R9X50_00408100 [Acrodontium crateriforme]|uniref:Aminoglycoside phosphotransferase domain-containing protein n=1 Tax=Acrodontium crateriforme TaxID=150365 RepID=A0AAQ3R819_9PEZI|nr:Hypothetical protein R9X50_00408100 [Acrodontium crateriforme]
MAWHRVALAVLTTTASVTKLLWPLRRRPVQLTWESSPADFLVARDEDVVNVFEGLESNQRTRRVSETVMVKRCDYREYCNLEFAWKMLNGCELRVPKPFRHFEYSDGAGFTTGYLIMEYLSGQPWEHLNDPCYDDAVIRAIRHLHRIDVQTIARGLNPGSIDNKPADGFPWGENGSEIVFTSMEQVTQSVNKRLQTYARGQKAPASQYMIDFTKKSLVLCHLDLAPRNILILDDGSVALIDWETLAFYPIEFELACISKLQYDNPTRQQKVLLDGLVSHSAAATDGGKDDMEALKETMKRLRIVDRQSIRYHYGEESIDDEY